LCYQREPQSEQVGTSQSAPQTKIAKANQRKKTRKKGKKKERNKERRKGMNEGMKKETELSISLKMNTCGISRKS
jgi:hypothetical protein